MKSYKQSTSVNNPGWGVASSREGVIDLPPTYFLKGKEKPSLRVIIHHVPATLQDLGRGVQSRTQQQQPQGSRSSVAKRESNNGWGQF